MTKLIDETGQQYGKWKVLYRVENGPNHGARWYCKCECGKEKIVYGNSLRKGTSLSCGCSNYKNLWDTPIRHGMTGTKIYDAWTHMRVRCLNPNNKSYKNYGGRGITICKEWDVFESFMEWSLTNGYSEELSIDRIDNSGNYEPSNCRWTTNKVQQNNTRFNRLLTFNGVTMTFAQWSEHIGISQHALYHRLKHNWSEEEIVKPRYCKNK